MTHGFGSRDFDSEGSDLDWYCRSGKSNLRSSWVRPVGGQDVSRETIGRRRLGKMGKLEKERRAKRGSGVSWKYTEIRH